MPLPRLRFSRLSVPQAALNAQGLESPETVNRIVGSEVRQEEAKTTAEAGKVSTAIDRTRENIGTVRKTSKLDKVDIVFLTDAARSEGGPPPAIESKVKQHQDDIAELRKEIEANALLFNAIDSRRVLAAGRSRRRIRRSRKDRHLRGGQAVELERLQRRQHRSTLWATCMDARSHSLPIIFC